MSALIPFDQGAVPSGYVNSGNNLGDGFIDFETPNKITLKGGRFRMHVGGAEISDTPGPLNVVIQSSSPYSSRSFYAAAYDQNAEATAPDCFSEDGVTPSVRAKARQSQTCAMCPNNVKGANGMKACRTFKRIVVTLADDPEKSLYQMDCAALSLFGDDDTANSRFNLKNLGVLFTKRNIPSSAVVTRVAVDTKASVSKMLFTPLAIMPVETHKAREISIDPAEVEKLLKTDIMVNNALTPALAHTPNIALPAATQAQTAPAPQAQAPTLAATPVVNLAPATAPKKAKPAPAAQAQAPAQAAQAPQVGGGTEAGSLDALLAEMNLG